MNRRIASFQVSCQRGITLVEILVTTTICLTIVAGLGSFVRATTESKTSLEAQIDLTREASFAMDRMVRAVGHSRRLLLPLADNSVTTWRENVREQTVPASLPETGSVLATAVLALTPPEYLDLDFDGIPDIDNDRDGRVDEDAASDRGFDYAAGVPFIDDDGDGLVDEVAGGNAQNDDEAQTVGNEDPLNGVDDDGDGSIDEDPSFDLNADGCPGICLVDDDGDGLIDEGADLDDDEDGSTDEDWYDVLAYYLDGDVLKERMPVPWDEDQSGEINGLDFIVSDIVAGVSHLRFERVFDGKPGWVIVDITLELTRDGDQIVSLNRRLRVGGAL